jgi:small subunit ribosomal protein S1
VSEQQDNGTVIEHEEYTDEEMHALIDGTMTDFDEGDLVSGTIVKVERDEVLLDIGYKSEGVIPARELSIRKDVNPADVVSMGDSVEALVLQKEDKDGRLILSKKRAEYERAWSQIEEKFNAGEVVEGEVIEVVKGGLILDIGLRGFLPASLVDLRRVKDLAAFMGDRLEARVIEMDRNRNNVVLSRRVVLEEGRKHERAAILEKLAKGQILPGTVSSIVDFGAFVDLGGIDGLVHISELSWSHVNHPSEVVKVGDPVEVKVLDVDMDRERISLGLKQTQPDPWQELVKKFPVGSIIEGKVTKLVPFGSFVELGDGVEGLVHISEMAKVHVETPEQVTAVGESVMIKVKEVDLDRRRISLSMKDAAEALGTVIEVAELETPEGDEYAEEVSEEAAEVVEVEGEEVAEDVADEVSEGEVAEEEPAAEEAEPVEEAAEEEPAAEEAEPVEEAAEEEPAAEVVEEVVVEEEPAEAEAEAAEVVEELAEPVEELAEPVEEPAAEEEPAAQEEPAAEEEPAEEEPAEAADEDDSEK